MLDPLNLENGKEQYENYISRIAKKPYVQYDYRHIDGELFSCIANNLDEARGKRDKWLERKGVN